MDNPQLLERLEGIVRETYNTQHRIMYNGREWTLYIVSSRTMFTGTFNEIITLATDEILCYRKPSPQGKHIKNYKPFTY